MEKSFVLFRSFVLARARLNMFLCTIVDKCIIYTPSATMVTYRQSVHPFVQLLRTTRLDFFFLLPLREHINMSVCLCDCICIKLKFVSTIVYNSMYTTTLIITIVDSLTFSDFCFSFMI